LKVPECVDSNFLGSRGTHFDSAASSWEKAENAIKKTKISRDNFFMEGSFEGVIYGNTVEIQ
jgi:hypothetical protein